MAAVARHLRHNDRFGDRAAGGHGSSLGLVGHFDCVPIQLLRNRDAGVLGFGGVGCFRRHLQHGLTGLRGQLRHGRQCRLRLCIPLQSGKRRRRLGFEPRQDECTDGQATGGDQHNRRAFDPPRRTARGRGIRLALGAPVDVREGLSGECVRSGLLVSCEDMENDPRIDPEIGRTLGIGSLMAAPVVSDFQVIGLLEVFSPRPHRFTKAHGTVLDQLVEMIPKPHRKKAQPENAEPEMTQPETPVRPEAVSDVSPPPASDSGLIEFESIQALREALWEREHEFSEQVSPPLPEIIAEQIPEQAADRAPAAPSRLLYRTLIGLAIAVIAMALGYLAGPIVERRWTRAPQASRQSAVEAASTVSRPSAIDHDAKADSLGSLRSLADRGDADAQWQVGVRYHNGEGVPRDDAQAMQWFLRAAEQGHVIAQATLGAYYWAGRGVPQDLSKAYLWSYIALAQGDVNSKSRLEGLASQMTRAQVLAARQQAEAWLRSHNLRAKSEAN